MNPSTVLCLKGCINKVDKQYAAYVVGNNILSMKIEGLNIFPEARGSSWIFLFSFFFFW